MPNSGKSIASTESMRRESMKKPFNIKVLYAEDDITIRIPMTEMLKRRVKELYVAENGEEALKAFPKFKPDIVLTDIRMPKMDGLSLIRETKEINPEIRTIIVSAHDDAEFFLKAIALGVDGFLLKPIDKEKLFDQIKKHAQIIEAQKKNEETKIILQALSTEAQDAIIITNKDGHLLFSNKAAHELFGRQLIKGEYVPELLCDTERFASSMGQTMKENIDFKCRDCATIHPEKGEVPLELSMRAVDINDEKHLLMFFHDIILHKNREHELIKAKEKAEEAGLARLNFLSVMSHEIRTPLNGIIGTAKLLLDEEPRDDQVQYLQTLDYSSNHLLSLVNDILDFSKIEASKIEFEKAVFNIKDVLKNQMQIFAFKASERNIKLHLEMDELLPERLLGDATRLNQILTNLIGNAVKFTKNGSIHLICKVLHKSTEEIKIQFHVVDTGIGIAQEKQATIFEAFSQAGADINRQFGGSGLGLNISKKLVEMQDGCIGLKSKEGHGSTFFFELPFGILTEKMEAVASNSNEIKDLEGIRILLVEDNLVNQMIASRFLKKWKAEVHIANNGEEALKKYKPELFHIILMDIQMPVMDGFEATRILRKTDKEIPVIALTASVHKEIKDTVFNAGMSDFISKPFIPGELNKIIAKYVF